MPTIAEVREQFPQYSDLSDTQLAGALHQKFYADMDPNAFAEKIGLKPDKYRQAAIDERNAGGGDTNVNAAGRFLRNAIVPAPLRMIAGAADDLSGGYLGALAQRGQQGATLGARDEILAALETPSEMYRRGTFDPREGYSYAQLDRLGWHRGRNCGRWRNWIGFGAIRGRSFTIICTIPSRTYRGDGGGRWRAWRDCRIQRR
jgi:hypothetical protein